MPSHTDVLTLARRHIAESNKIEGILRPTTDLELEEYFRFMELKEVAIADLTSFVDVYQPGAHLRLNGELVRVGNYYPPAGGMHILYLLESLLATANDASNTDYEIHQRYEKLHPFTDGNGRSGRMLWYWMNRKNWAALERGFLHSWYYESLSAHRLVPPT